MTLLDDQILNSLSRRDGKTYICRDCGRQEALIDMGAIEPTREEREFVRKHG